MQMNRYDIKDMWAAMENRTDLPNLRAGAKTLYRLLVWVDSHSDGWPYWQKPSNASKRLQEVLHETMRLNHHGVPMNDPEDIPEAELKRLLSPVKAFLTKQGIDHAEVIAPAVEPCPTLDLMDTPVTVEQARSALGEEPFGFKAITTTRHCENGNHGHSVVTGWSVFGPTGGVEFNADASLCVRAFSIHPFQEA